MGDKTAISWTNATWNPIRGCSKVSEGCRNCYAMSVAARFSGPGQPYEGLAKQVNGKPAWTGEVRFIDKHLLDPLHWKKPRMIFVNSMSDVFHEDVQDQWLVSIFAVMALAQRHTFQVLTKRPQIMQAYLSREWLQPAVETLMRMWAKEGIGPAWPLSMQRGEYYPVAWPLQNVWLGTSVENQAAADERIPHLLATPAAVRFLSCEPLLGPVNLAWYLWRLTLSEGSDTGVEAIPRNLLHWVIDGGESGPHFRKADHDWYRGLRDQCVNAGVAYFHKQDSGPRSGTGTLLDGVEWHQFPTATA